LLGSCVSNPYFIGRGANCQEKAALGAGVGGDCGSGGGGGSDANLSFALDLDQSGSSHLEPKLTLSTATLTASLLLRGENANANAWRSDQGQSLSKGPGVADLELETPFTDSTRAIGSVSDQSSYLATTPDWGAVDADDFAIELVLRVVPGATIVDKSGDSGWSLKVAADSTLVLSLDDGSHSLTISSAPLVDGAWYHCLSWLSHDAGGQVLCNGREGPLTPATGLGSLASTTPLAFGGGTVPSGERSELAYFALYRAAAGNLGSAADWRVVARRRFSELTGVAPRVALGSALSAQGLRDSAAYLDRQLSTDGSRHLFLVGPDWPRIACRSDVNQVRDCGYLSESKRTRWVDPRASQWIASEVTVATSDHLFADDEQPLSGLVPSTANTDHSLSVTGAYGGARQAFSFFARAEAGHLVAVNVSNLGSAIFDLNGGSVVSAPNGTQASLEAWGNGLFRCQYVFTPSAGKSTYTLSPLNDVNARPFAGDGTHAWLDVAGLQLDVGQAYSGSLLAADAQAADQLSFVGNDGNVPSSATVTERLRVLLPAGPRLTDQALVSLNLSGQFDNQVELYVTGDTSELKFWGIQQGATHWAFKHPVSFVDGQRHALEASWGPDFARLAVDGTSLEQMALIANQPSFALDQIDIGFALMSSGSLDGLIAGLEIGSQ